MAKSKIRSLFFCGSSLCLFPPFPGWQPISIGKAKKFRKATAIAIAAAAAAAAASSWSSNFESSIYVSAKYSYINCVCIYSLLPHTMYDSIEPRASSVLSVPLPLSYSLSLLLSLSLSVSVYLCNEHVTKLLCSQNSYNVAETKPKRKPNQEQQQPQQRPTASTPSIPVCRNFNSTVLAVGSCCLLASFSFSFSSNSASVSGLLYLMMAVKS